MPTFPHNMTRQEIIDSCKPDVDVKAIARKIINLHEYSDRTGIKVTRSIAGLLGPLNSQQTSDVIDLVTAAFPPRPKPEFSALGGTQ